MRKCAKSLISWPFLWKTLLITMLGPQNRWVWHPMTSQGFLEKFKITYKPWSSLCHFDRILESKFTTFVASKFSIIYKKAFLPKSKKWLGHCSSCETDGSKKFIAPPAFHPPTFHVAPVRRNVFKCAAPLGIPEPFLTSRFGIPPFFVVAKMAFKRFLSFGQNDLIWW